MMLLVLVLVLKLELMKTKAKHECSNDHLAISSAPSAVRPSRVILESKPVRRKVRQKVNQDGERTQSRGMKRTESYISLLGPIRI